MSNKEEAIIWYRENRDTYKRLSMKVELILKDILELNKLSYQTITSRAKDLDSFKDKALKDKYDNPIEQIKDMAGVRIIAYVESDVEKITDIIEREFVIDFENSINKSSNMEVDRFGYRSIHYIAKFSETRSSLPEFMAYKDIWFEIQVRTILQHAWAEIEHDRNYKIKGKSLPNEKDIKRRFYLLAGILEMTDREFNSIVTDIDIYASEVSEETKMGKFDIELNSISLKEYLINKFPDEINNKLIHPEFGDRSDFIAEITDFGISTLKQLDEIIEDIGNETIAKILIENPGTNFTGFLRLILIITDADLYFTKANKQNWTARANFSKALKVANIDLGVLKEKYNYKELKE